MDEGDFIVDVESPLDTLINLSQLSQVTLEIALALGLQTDVTDDAWDRPNLLFTIFKAAAKTTAALTLFHC